MTQTTSLAPGDLGVQMPERWRPGRVGAVARIAVMAAILAFLFVIPHIIPRALVTVVILAAIYAIVGLSMNVLMGYAGQVSLGHAAFYGIGAFVAGWAVGENNLPFAFGLFGAGLSGALTAIFLGGIALRLKGLYLALVTIAYGAVAELTLFKLPMFNGGAGVSAPRPSLLANNITYAYFVYGVLAVALFLDWRLMATKAGRAIQALRDDERVAASWGINVTAYKLLAFVISGVLAGVGGALFAHMFEGVASSQFGFQLSLTFVLMTVVGGLGNRWGVIQGAVVIATLPTLLDQAHGAWGEGNVFGNIVQTLLGLAILGLALALLAKAAKVRKAGPLIAGVFALGLLYVAAFLTLGGWMGDTSAMHFVVWHEIDSQIESIIGAALLLVTLIFFPGGIAEQQADLLRWLSFGKFHDKHDDHGVGAASGMGGESGRP